MGMDPKNLDCYDGPSEFCWGKGLVPPGVAQNEAQRRAQADFGAGYPQLESRIGSADDDWARMVADKRTDTTDPDSNRDFEVLGNQDRYGGQPAMIQEPTVPNRNQRLEIRPARTVRRG